MIIGIDFDGTVVAHEYPEIGRPAPQAIETLRELTAAGHRLVLWTMRSGAPLQEAVNYLTAAGVELWGVNRNPEQHEWTDSPKAYCQLYIDDAAYGAPLMRLKGARRPVVDWEHVRAYLYHNGLIGQERVKV